MRNHLSIRNDYHETVYFRPPRVKNLDHGSAQQMAVTVDDVTVIITDYPIKRRKISSDASKNNVQSDMSDSSSNASNDIMEERTVQNSNT